MQTGGLQKRRFMGCFWKRKKSHHRKCRVKLCYIIMCREAGNGMKRGTPNWSTRHVMMVITARYTLQRGTLSSRKVQQLLVGSTAVVGNKFKDFCWEV